MRHRKRLTSALCLSALMMGGCSKKPELPTEFGSAKSVLEPVENPIPPPTVQRTVYVALYSSIYLGIDRAMVDLSATVSVRNVSSVHPVILNFARYYDSKGHQIRDYLDRPSKLGPLATVEFVIQKADRAGGPGANFLVQWTGPANIDEPLMEAVMVGQSGPAGISFTSTGRTVKNE